MSTKREDEWLGYLARALEIVCNTPGAPWGDADQLLLRVQDILRWYTGDVRDAALEHLVRDVARFDEEHPGLLPAELLFGPEKPEDAWLRHLTMALKEAIGLPEALRKDAEQLLVSIQDVRRWRTADVRRAAFKDVEKDVARFAEEHPGVLPAELVGGPARD